MHNIITNIVHYFVVGGHRDNKVGMLQYTGHQGVKIQHYVIYICTVDEDDFFL